MQGHLVVPVSHPFLMKDKQVIDLTLIFLEKGSWKREDRKSGVEPPLRGKAAAP